MYGLIVNNVYENWSLFRLGNKYVFIWLKLWNIFFIFMLDSYVLDIILWEDFWNILFYVFFCGCIIYKLV